MLPFSFEKVRTEQDAIRAAAAGGRYIAGGTTLMTSCARRSSGPSVWSTSMRFL